MPASDPDVEHVDVLIIGAGPAGLALANWFRSSDVQVCLLEKKPWTTQRGQAEGLKSTSLEIFETIGIGPQIWGEVFRQEEQAIWGPQKNADGSAAESGLVRELTIPDKTPQLGKIREVMLQQCRVEHHMLQNLKSSPNIECRFSTVPIQLQINESQIGNERAHPISVVTTACDPETTQQLFASEAKFGGDASLVKTTKTVTTNGVSISGDVIEAHPDFDAFAATRTREIRTKYVVACDGAHSWTRQQLGVKLQGDLTDSVFGVIDIVPRTNFPDIRKSCYLRSASGTIMTIPRPNREVRFYIPVETGSVLSNSRELSFERIVDAARKIIAPYTLDVLSCSWWSAYRVGQRVGDRFSVLNRAFLAGDAVHTHSPKAGHGMNMGIQDAFNLGWKLRQVLQGQAPESLLSTYDLERRQVAEDFINFDRGYLKLFCEYSYTFESQLRQGMKFSTGISIRYRPSCVVQYHQNCEDTGPSPSNVPTSALKVDLVPGKRLPDFQMVAHCDNVPITAHQRLQATGAFRILAFPGDVAQQASLRRLHRLGDWLADPIEGLGKLTRSDNALLEALVIHSAERHCRELFDFPEVFRLCSETEGIDYWRVYADVESAHDGHGRAYERLELDPYGGCAVLVRPDNYVGAVMGIEDFGAIRDYFAPFSEAAKAAQSPDSASLEGSVGGLSIES